MKEMTRYGLTLAIICMVASAALAVVNSVTKPKILAQAQAEEQSSLKEVLPQAAKFEPVESSGEVIYYKAYDKAGKFIGVAFKASAKGYSSVIETMVGMLKDGTIETIEILNQNETPGLGARVAEPDFISRFKGISAADLDKVETITGATISSKAVRDSVKEKAEELKDVIKNEE